jgi:hypothetical protein
MARKKRRNRYYGLPTVFCRFGVQFLTGMTTTFSMGVFSTQ